MTILRLRAAACAALLAAAPAMARAPVVETRSGAVQGQVHAGARQYLGIPYAAPPVGERRWRPPAEPSAWTGIRQATSFGGRCPQAHDLGAFAAPSVTEDCLSLNVYTPDRAARAPRAVMLWIPGGGQRVGAGSDYDGSALAARGDIIVVTINYRIGMLGYLSHPAIDGEGHAGGNYGIMDQQAALRWVRDNIARFGGDPARVTIAGHSSGGTGVLLHLIAPGSRGLFAQAIIQSAGSTALRRAAEARRIGARFASDAGCADQSARCLRGLTVAQVLGHQPGLSSVGPSVDGQVIDAPPEEALASGRFARVPAINGIAADEPTFFLTLGGETSSQSPAQIAAAQAQTACTARRRTGMLAAHVPVFAYQFDERAAPSYLAKTSFPLGAFHGSELPFLFPGFRGGSGTPVTLTAAQRRLSGRMIADWARFVRTGDPGWPRFDARRDNLQSLSAARSVVQSGARYGCVIRDKAP